MSSQFVKLPAVSGGGGGSGANTTLSNLTAPIAVNQDLLPDVFNPMTMTGRQLGSAVKPWLNLYAVSAYVATVNAVPGLDLSISAGASNTIRFVDSSLTTASNGYVWALQDQTTGRGGWVAGGGGGANATLSNLTSPTSVNQDLLSSKATWTVGSTAVNSMANSTNVVLSTGENTGMGGSGTLTLQTGAALAGIMTGMSGNMVIKTGDGFMSSGNIDIFTGTSSVRGNITIRAKFIDCSNTLDYFRMPVRSGDPASPQNGAIWYDTSTNKLRAFVNGAAVNIV